MKFYSTLFLFFFTATFIGQNIEGEIKNSKSKPIENAILLNINSHTHFHTDESGKFILENTKVGDTIRISKLGFLEKKIPILSMQHLSIQLEDKIFSIEELIVQKNIKSFQTIAEIDLKTNPVNSSQELLRKVPGLFIGQHAGGGKAEQIFLRGFDIDHGTDIALDVDGMPVNMVSHAHGQGYADLHFLIPETVQKIDFDKGPYYSNKGNLATAGYVSFQTKKTLEHNLISLEVGQFNTKRTLGLFNLINNEKQQFYVASDYQKTDGPFRSPQNFNRFNFFTKYNSKIDNHNWFSIALFHFKSKWDASGQIPQRAVDSGLIDRFGAIDDTEGGTTQRSGAIIKYEKEIDEKTNLKNTFYYSYYDFELFSNFTFFLNDPINGDQIKQKEKRNTLGFESILNKKYNINNLKTTIQYAIGLRNDETKNSELSHTLNRQITLTPLQLGNITETNYFGYINADFNIGKWLINPSIRLDYFEFEYQNELVSRYKTQTDSKTVFSPKINILYQVNEQLNVYSKSGQGFHTNDTRVIVTQNLSKTIPNAFGTDLGTNWKPSSKIWLNMAFWYLHLGQEFIYVGDEAVVELGGKTERKGIDFGLRYQFTKNLYFSTDFTYTLAKKLDTPSNENFIPLAPKVTWVGSLSFISANHFTMAINSRYLGNRPANENNTIIAKGYFITDFNLSYQFGNGIELGGMIQNIFNSNWNETQFATESRLQNEINSVTEIHFTPGTPFNGKFFLKYKF
ncbi:MAG: TonB-dependent receptor [Flavobacterium sp.]